MKNKMMNSTGVVFAISMTLVAQGLTPALAQSFVNPDPPVTPPVIIPSAPPPQVQIQQQPSALQTMFQNMVQQSQMQNMLNGGQLPAFIQNNPAISPLDQRSGLSNNANSINAGNNLQATLGISQGKAPVANGNLVNNSPLATQKDLGIETANRFGGPTASSLFQVLFLAANGQPVGLKPADTDKTPTDVLYGALVGLARANNVPISDSLQQLFESMKSNPAMFELVRPTLVALTNGISGGTMQKQTLTSALTFLSNPKILQGFMAGVQSANLTGRSAEQTKQLAEQIKTFALGTLNSGTAADGKQLSARAMSLLGGAALAPQNGGVNSSFLNLSGSLLSSLGRGKGASGQAVKQP